RRQANEAPESRGLVWIQVGSRFYLFSLRRSTPANPRSPVPNRAREAGSGVCVVLPPFTSWEMANAVWPFETKFESASNTKHVPWAPQSVPNWPVKSPLISQCNSVPVVIANPPGNKLSQMEPLTLELHESL